MTVKKACLNLLLLCLFIFFYGKLFTQIKPLLVTMSGVEFELLKKGLFAAGLLGSVYVLDLHRQAGLVFKINWRTLYLYWPVALIALMTLAGAATNTSLSTLVKIAFLTLFVGIAEELMFRGLVFHWFNQVSLFKRIIISAFSFAAVHLSGIFSGVDPSVIFAQVYFAAGLGIIFAYARSQDYSIMLPIIVHSIFNFIAIGGKGGVTETFSDVEKMVFGLLFAGTIAWAWSAFLLWKVGKKVEKRLS